MLIYRGSFSVFSTSVEVILTVSLSLKQISCILHECGGDPILDATINVPFMYSPRVWRWSHKMSTTNKTMLVFSTSVEVILQMKVQEVPHERILHECGGDPDKVDQAVKTMQVFSTSVEVIPISSFDMSLRACILHTCGGDPDSSAVVIESDKYSPHMWRWSSDGVPRGCPSSYSPHMWRLNSCSEKYVL